MRVDFQQLLPHLGDSAMGKRIAQIAELEQYTLLNPPYDKDDVQELGLRAQEALKARLPDSYFLLMKCFDGGLLFTNDLFSLYAPEEPEMDLVSANRELWDEGLIPRDKFAFAMTNYGDYYLLSRGGGPEVTQWDMEENKASHTFPDLLAWLDDVLNEARYLLKEDSLPVMIDPDEVGDE